MGLFFKSNQKKASLSIIKNLIAMSSIDGEFHQNEMELVAAIAHREGLSEKEFKKLALGNDKTPFTIPNDNATKEKYLKDMVGLMMVDGHIDEKELSLCKMTAIKFGYRPEVIDAMFFSFLNELRK